MKGAAVVLLLAGCSNVEEAPVENRLARESSPYLLQHRANPVDWHPWGPEALEKARHEDKPIFLSIGYSACHWCHVMAHESFESAETAKLMNEHFVNIKVDREERPDLDEIYMQAVMAMTGSGGWPMSVWLTPDLKPFYGGTYFPPDSRHGRPSFRTVLEGTARAWKEKRGEVEKSAGQLADMIRSHMVLEGGADGALDRAAVADAANGLKKHFDAEWGGFGGAPKFPSSMDLNLLLREWKRTGDASVLQMVEVTLDRMARGGMYDQLGGGFHRYSTDEEWLIPHFEKMLYDNALLIRSYLQAWQATGKAEYARIVRETAEYVLREMVSPEGGFYAAQDADSEGEEGKFFVWTPEEVGKVLGKDADLFCRTYGVTKAGNFEHSGRSALWLEKPVEDRLEPMKAKLLAEREKRIKPGLDSKILADWNGLMVRALAEAGSALEEPRYVDAARKAAGFCLGRRKDGRLLHTAALPAYLDDHAFLLAGCLALLEATGEGRWLAEAKGLASDMEKHFWDQEGGGFFFTADDHEKLIARTKHPGDNAIPSGNSVAAEALVRLSALTDEKKWRDMGERTLSVFAPFYARSPRGFGEMLCALEFATAEPMEIVVVGDEASRAPFLKEIRKRFLPNAIVLPVEPGASFSPLLEGKEKPAAYVCSGGACRKPVTEPGELGRAIDRP